MCKYKSFTEQEMIELDNQVERIVHGETKLPNTEIIRPVYDYTSPAYFLDLGDYLRTKDIPFYLGACQRYVLSVVKNLPPVSVKGFTTHEGKEMTIEFVTKAINDLIKRNIYYCNSNMWTSLVHIYGSKKTRNYYNKVNEILRYWKHEIIRFCKKIKEHREEIINDLVNNYVIVEEFVYKKSRVGV